MRLNSKLGGIMVLSPYQMGNQLDFNNGKKGSKTARLQQHSMLQEANRTCTLREAFVRDLIMFLLPARERGDSILIIQKIISAEENAEVYRKLNALKDTYNLQLNRIQEPANEFADPKECTEWRSADLPNEIEEYRIKRNQKHFGQAQGSFPTVPPFSEHVEWAALSHESEFILSGD